MKVAKALSLALVVGAAALITISAGAARSKALHFTVLSAKASATLTFHTADTVADETSDGKIVLIVSSKGRAKASIPGRVRVPLKGKLSERVITKTHVSTTSPYQETCSNVRKLGGRGGVTLKRKGSKVEVRWAFPQAKPSFCTGPAAGSNLTSRMKRTYSLKALSGKHVAIVLNGAGKTPGETSAVTYKWHAVVKLVRR